MQKAYTLGEYYSVANHGLWPFFAFLRREVTNIMALYLNLESKSLMQHKLKLNCWLKEAPPRYFFKIIQIIAVKWHLMKPSADFALQKVKPLDHFLKTCGAAINSQYFNIFLNTNFKLFIN